MKSKLRIQLFDPEGKLTEDRMVDQTTEFYMGPKSEHKGPIRIEFTLVNQNDVDKAITYLKQLTGGLEIPKKRGRTSTQPQTNEMSTDQRKELLDTALTKKDQNKFFEFLRNEGDFRFVDQTFLKTLGLWGKLGLSELHQNEKFSYMMRAIKFAKDPKNDKYDPQMVICTKLIGKRSERLSVYLNGELYKKLKLSVPKHQTEVLKSSGAMKFDRAMTEDEREKFRRELRELQVGTRTKKSKFFARWEPFVRMP